MQGSYDKADNTVLDPVCGMYVVPEKSAGHVRHQQTDYYFCSKHCEQKFSSNPGEYLKRKPSNSNLVQLGAIAPAKRSPAQQGIITHHRPAQTGSASTPKARYICPMD